MAGEFDDDATLEEGPAPAPPKKGMPKMIIFGIPILLIFGVISYIIVVRFFLSEMPEPVEEEIVQEEVEKEAH